MRRTHRAICTYRITLAITSHYSIVGVGEQLGGFGLFVRFHLLKFKNARHLTTSKASHIFEFYKRTRPKILKAWSAGVWFFSLWEISRRDYKSLKKKTLRCYAGRELPFVEIFRFSMCCRYFRVAQHNGPAFQVSS